MSNPREILLRWKPETNSVRCRLTPLRATLRAQHVPRPELPRSVPPPEIPPAVDEDGPLYLAFPIAVYHVPDPVEIPYHAPHGERGLNGQDGVDNEVTNQVGVRSGVTGQFDNSTAEDGQLGNGNVRSVRIALVSLQQMLLL